MLYDLVADCVLLFSIAVRDQFRFTHGRFLFFFSGAQECIWRTTGEEEGTESDGVARD